MNSASAQGCSSGPSPVGIDLGTTYSVLAYVDGSGRPQVAPNRDGDLLTPSAVLIEGGQVIVGKEAVRVGTAAPDRYAECFKRDMGMAKYHRPVNGLAVPPPVLSAFVLQRLAKDAQECLGSVGPAVITVPAFFDEGRRSQTQLAGRMAGLQVLDIINEPTAAALAFGYGRMAEGDDWLGGKPRNIVVYDLGGGTFDVTVMRIQQGTFQTLATDGDVCLGGKDWDERLVNYLADQFLAAHGADPRSDPVDAAALWQQAQEAKHSLSLRPYTTVPVSHGGIRATIKVTRELFEELTADLLERTRCTTALVVKTAGLSWNGIDWLLLVGGSTRMPAVARMLTELFGRQPQRLPSPDLAVAEGASLYAATLLRSDFALGHHRCQVVNVNSHSLGVVCRQRRTGRRVVAHLIAKNSKLPCQVTRTFHTYKPDQRRVTVAVVEGESSRPEQCILLGECVVNDLRPGLPQGAEVQVDFRYEPNGLLSVWARVPAARQSAHVEINRAGAVSDENLENWRRRLCAASEEPAGIEPLEAVQGPGETELPTDPAGLTRRLDELYLRVGTLALGLELPAELAATREAAKRASSDLRQAQTRLYQLQSKGQQGTSRAETVQRMSSLAKLRTELKEAETANRFTLIALGRDCFASGFDHPSLEQLYDQIEQVRGLLAS